MGGPYPPKGPQRQQKVLVWHSGPLIDMTLPKIHHAADNKESISVVGQGDLHVSRCKVRVHRHLVADHGIADPSGGTLDVCYLPP